MKAYGLMRCAVIAGSAIAMATCFEGSNKVIECPGTDWMCPATMQCAPDGKALCLDKKCGNGYLDGQNEQCDGDLKGHGGETAACNLNCTNNICGDGWVNAHTEECDGDGHGHGGQTAQCNANCTAAKHGDGVVNGAFEGEECDGGNGTCKNAYCTDKCKWNIPINCGNGVPDSGEECDDGNNNGNMVCSKYGETCSLCNKGCKSENVDGPRCGDHKIDADYAETCDSDASVACGTCGATGATNACQTIKVASATGNITVTDAKTLQDQAKNADHDSFTVGSVTFELANTGNCNAANVCVIVGNVATDPIAIAGAITNVITNAISARGLSFSVNNTGNTVTLTDSTGFPGANKTITAKGSRGFTVEGMGGAVGCGSQARCDLNSDCVSGSCDSTKRCQ